MKTDITVVLDRSGSMELIKSDTIGGFNGFLAKQQELDSNTRFSMVQFNNHSSTIYSAVKIKSVDPLTNNGFRPMGGTALLDALGRTIDATGIRLRMMDTEDRPDNVIFVIITDGEENSSRQFTRRQIFDKISHQQSVYKWEFVFLGANQDAIKEASAIGIPVYNSLSYGLSKGEINTAYMAMSESIGTRSKGIRGASAGFTDEDRIGSLTSKKK